MAATTLLLEFETIRHRWGWLLALGILMIVLGTIAFFLVPAATLGTVLVLGWLLLVSGIIECIQAIRERSPAACLCTWSRASLDYSWVCSWLLILSPGRSPGPCYLRRASSSSAFSDSLARFA